MNPLVSLIVPLYNAMPYFADFLASVAGQTWHPLECVIADDGSADGSLEYLESRLPMLAEAGIWVKILRLPHGGQAAAVNAALKEVSGEYLTWCDADDIMLPRCIEEKVRFLEEHPALGLVRSDGLVLDENGEILRHSAKEEDRHTQWIFDGLLKQSAYCYAGCYMVRMSLFLTCYPDRTIPLSPEGQNLQMLLPPASRTMCGFVPEVLHHYYLRPTGHSGQKRSYTETLRRTMNFIELCREILRYCDCDTEYYEKVIDGVREKRLGQLKYSMLIRAKEELKKSEGRDTHLS